MIRIGISVETRGTVPIEAVRRAVKTWAREAADELTREMQAIIRTRQRKFGSTGTLLNSVKGVMEGAGFTVGPNAPYALFVDQPTRPHEIRPRNKKALAFASGIGRRGTTQTGKAFQVVKYGGREVRRNAIFAASVRHPGTRGMFFVDATVRAGIPRVAAALERAVERELTR